MSGDEALRVELAELGRLVRGWAEWLADSGVEELASTEPADVVLARLSPRVAERAAPRPGATKAARTVAAAARASTPTDQAPEPERLQALAGPVAVRVRSDASPAAAPRPPTGPWPGTGLASATRRERLAALSAEVEACRRCPLGSSRTRVAFARGSPDAKLVFIGEGPGKQEDLQGAPFVGPAGQLLDKMIAGMGLEQDEIYICNIVKCRPPNPESPMLDRKPDAREMASCMPWLMRQLELLDPEVIVALGGTAVQGLLGTRVGITRLRGKWKLLRGRIPVMPTFHPSYLLRSEDRNRKRQVWNDLKEVLSRLGRTPPAPARHPQGG